MTDTVLLEELTWTDVESRLESGTTTAIVPVASTEQHGPHLPLATDALIGEAVATGVAERLGDALVAPTIRPGVSGHHMAFAGSLTIDADQLMDLLHSYAESLASHGFEYVVLLPSHGGNFAPVNTAAPEIARDVDADVIALADIQEFMALMNEGLAAAGVDYQEEAVHAGATETAVIQALRPELVRDERRPKGHEGALSVSALLSKGFKHFTENGVLGDARKSTPEAGEEILETLSDALAERVRDERSSL